MEDRRGIITGLWSLRLRLLRLLRLLLVVAVGLVFGGGEAFGDQETLRGVAEAVAAKEDAGAERLLKAALLATPGDVGVRLYWVDWLMGRGAWGEAEVLLLEAVGDGAGDGLGDVEAADAADMLARLGDVYWSRGEAGEAKKYWEAALKKQAGHPRASVQLAKFYEASGKRERGKVLLNGVVEAYSRGKIEGAEDLVWAGDAAYGLEYFEDANRIFFEAQGADAGYIGAYLAAGTLFLEKYNQRDAAAMFERALAIDPKHPGALVGMARVHLDSDFNVGKARALGEEALKIDPGHLGALALLTKLALVDDDVGEALAFTERALAQNPRHLESLALKAAAHYVADDLGAFAAVEAAISKLNPGYAALYVTVAEHAEIAHRYEETVAFYKKALAVDAGYWRAFQGLGLALTRGGDDVQGLSYLKKAFEHDPYNVRAYNLLELYDKTLSGYETLVLAQGVTLRLPRDEGALLALYLPALIEDAVEVYTKKYKTGPKLPLQIELFRDPTHFAVRSVGLPSLSSQGICFGHLITARAPASGAFNWGQLLWHELAHSFHLDLAKGRVPRWFTEGLAEYETTVARPEWRREHDIPLHLRLRADQLPSTAELNQAFTSAKSSAEVSLAYYLSALTVEYIAETYGFDVLPAMLRAWGERKTTAQIFKSVLNKDLAAFDQAFHAWLGRRLSFLDASYELDLDALFLQHDDWLSLAAASPEDPDALARAGFARLLQRDLDGARLFSQRALKMAPAAILPNYLAAVLDFREGAYEDAEIHFKKLLTLGVDGYTLRCELAALALKLGHPELAVEHYEQAQRLFPSGDEPPRELARLYLIRKQPAQALSQLQRLVAVDQSDIQTLSIALDLAIQQSNPTLALALAERALYIDPFDQSLHLKTASLALDTSNWSLAEREFSAYLLLPHADAFPAHIGLALAYLETNQITKAQESLRLARAARPSSPELQPLETMLRQKAP